MEWKVVLLAIALLAIGFAGIAIKILVKKTGNLQEPVPARIRFLTKTEKPAPSVERAQRSSAIKKPLNCPLSNHQVIPAC